MGEISLWQCVKCKVVFAKVERPEECACCDSKLFGWIITIGFDTPETMAKRLKKKGED